MFVVGGCLMARGSDSLLVCSLLFVVCHVLLWLRCGGSRFVDRCWSFVASVLSVVC